MIIKFNLLPKVETPEKEVTPEKPIFLKIYSAILILIAFSMLILAFKIEKEINSLEKVKKEKNEVLVRYKSIADKVREIEKRSEETEKRIKIIVSLKEKQGITLKKMSTIFLYTGTNKVFFNNFHMNETEAKIKGTCLDLDLLANYMNNLESNKEIIRSINLKSAQGKKIGAIFLYDFELEVFF